MTEYLKKFAAKYVCIKRKVGNAMNMIVCSRNCRHQCDGYCCLEGRAVITNAVESPCCYYEERNGENDKNKKDM